MSADKKAKHAQLPRRGIFRTVDLPPEQRNAAWNEIAGPFFDHVVPLADKTMDGEIRSDLLGNWATCNIRFNQHSYARRRARRAEDEFDYYFIQLYRRGTLHGECAGRAVFVRPGDILILDVREALALRASAGEIITLIVPHADIERLPADLHGQVLLRERDATRQLAARFESLEALLPGMTADQVDTLWESTRASLIAAIDDALAQLGVEVQAHRPLEHEPRAARESGEAIISLDDVQKTLLDWVDRAV
ncbi:hypothetical protein [Guyparkeria sp.]|uniref:AraC-like ligand-binding domain-containing protein n=1 Tax=Guyparkeria sp. TaxID=2035736 RepID=UPI003970991C